VLAAVLLAVPFAALAGQALRVGSLALEREAAQLALAGATPADLRTLRARRTSRAFGLGALAAGPGLPPAVAAPRQGAAGGARLLPEPQVLARAGVGGGRGCAAPARGGRRWTPPLRTAAAGARVGARPPPSAARVASTAAAAVLLPLLAWRLDIGSSSALSAVLVLVEGLLLLVTVSGMVARRAARGVSTGDGSAVPGRARRRPVSGRFTRDPAVAVLAAAQRRSSPRAAGAVAGVLFVCGLSFGVEAALIADVLAPAQGLQQSDLVFYVGGALLAGALGLTGAVVALLALALSLTDHLLGARRSVASTAVLGTDLPRLVAVQTRALTTTAVPATAAGTLVAGSLYTVAGLLSSPAYGARTGAAVLAAVVLASLLVALACVGVARLLSGRVRSAAALEKPAPRR
jgi:hypothetical protein